MGRDDASFEIVDARAAAERQGDWLMVDVRPAEQFEEASASGAVSVPLYRKVEGTDMRSMLKVFIMSSLAVTAVEENEEFCNQVASLVNGENPAAGVILACSEGGSLRPSLPSWPSGKESRSLFAAYRLLTDPFTKEIRIAVLDGGLNAWFRAGMGGQGEREWTFNAKTPSSAMMSEVEAAAFDSEGRRVAKDRTARANSTTGYLIRDGGNALDPFGTWSVAMKGDEQKESGEET